MLEVETSFLPPTAVCRFIDEQNLKYGFLKNNFGD